MLCYLVLCCVVLCCVVLCCQCCVVLCCVAGLCCVVSTYIKLVLCCPSRPRHDILYMASMVLKPFGDVVYLKGIPLFCSAQLFCA